MVARRAKNAGRSKQVEDWLDQYNVNWEYYPAVDIEEFDIDQSLRNQARVFAPINEETVGTYTEAIKRGDTFPAVVAHQPNQRARMILVDGNLFHG